MAYCPNEEENKTSLLLLQLFKDACNELKASKPEIGDGIVTILTRFGERREYTAVAFWELILQETEDHSIDFDDESQSKRETTIIANDTTSQISTTYFENLVQGRDHWFLTQNFPGKNDIIDILHQKLEIHNNTDGGDHTELYLKLIQALENSPSKINSNKLLEHNNVKTGSVQSSPRQNVVELQSRNEQGNNTNRNNYRRNRQNYNNNNRQVLVRAPPAQPVPVNMPMVQPVPYNPYYPVPIPPAYTYGQAYYPMPPPPPPPQIRYPYPAPMPAVYPMRPPAPVPMSVPYPVQQPPVYYPGYVRYPSPIVYSQIIPAPPTVDYQYPPMDMQYNAMAQYQQYGNIQYVTQYMPPNEFVNNENVEYVNTEQVPQEQEQNIVYYFNNQFIYYSDEVENNGSECGSDCSCSQVSVCSQCFKEETGNETNNPDLETSNLPAAESANIAISEEITNIDVPSPLVEMSNETIHEETISFMKLFVEEIISSVEQCVKQAAKINVNSQDQPSTSSHNQEISPETSATTTTKPNNAESSEKQNLPSTSKSADDISISISKQKADRFAENLAKLRESASKETRDERLYLRTPTIFEILDSRKNMAPEEAERPPTSYMEDVIQRKERRWKQMDKIPGSPSLDTILDMIKKDLAMLEEEEREKKQIKAKKDEKARTTELKSSPVVLATTTSANQTSDTIKDTEREKQQSQAEMEEEAGIIELKAAPAMLEINIQAHEVSGAINESTRTVITNTMASQCDDLETYDLIILEGPVVVEPFVKPEKTTSTQTIPMEMNETVEVINNAEEPAIIIPSITIPPISIPPISEDTSNETSESITQQPTDNTEKQEIQSEIDDEERILLNNLENSNSGYKEVWIADETVLGLKDKLFEKWDKPKPKSRTTSPSTSGRQQQQQEQIEIEPEETFVANPSENPPQNIIREVRVYDARDASTQTDEIKIVKRTKKRVNTRNKYTQTSEPETEQRQRPAEPEVVTYASVVKKRKK